MPGLHRAQAPRTGPRDAARAGPAGRAVRSSPAPRAAGASAQAGRQRHTGSGRPPGRRGAATPPFGHHGFPKPLDPPKRMRWRTRQVQAAAPRLRSWRRSPPRCSSPWRSRAAPGTSGPQARWPGVARAGRATSTATARGAPACPSGPSRRPGHRRRPPRRAAAAGTCRRTPAAGGGAGPAPGTAPRHRPPDRRPAAGRRRPRPARRTAAEPVAPSPAPHPAAPGPARAAPPPPRQGTLTVSPTTIVLGPLNGGTITITASGGPVNWSVSESAEPGRQSSPSPRSGTLASARARRVSVSASGLARWAACVNPGGHRRRLRRGRWRRATGLHAHREPRRHRGHGRPRRQRQPEPGQPRRRPPSRPPAHRRTTAEDGLASGLSRCA